MLYKGYKLRRAGFISPFFGGGGLGVRGPEPDMDFKPCKTGCEATKAGVVN